MDVLIRASSSNADRVYSALAAFGAPLQNFEVQAGGAKHEGKELQRRILRAATTYQKCHQWCGRTAAATWAT